MILLDTNICAAAMRDDRRVTAKLLQYGGRVRIPFMVAAELRVGLRKAIRAGRPVSALQSRMDRFFAIAGGVVSLDSAVLACYAELRATLEVKGTVIGDTDLWIAAQALSEDALLVTDNTREFRRVPGLRTENWLVR